MDFKSEGDFMNLITWQSKANDAAERWYYDRSTLINFAKNNNFPDISTSIYGKLSALECPTKEAVDRIIGNPHWTECTCYECGQDTGIAIEFTMDIGDFRLCPDCLTKALEKMNG